MILNSSNDAEFLPTRQSLLERLRRWDDDKSWQEFFDTYWMLIYRAARKTGLRENEAEEVVQETVISVARKMPDFQYRPPKEGGSFKQWLLNLTKWKINDQLRKRYRDNVFVELADEESGEAGSSPLPDPLSNKLDEMWDSEWKDNLISAALERVKSRVDARDFQVFQLSALKGWSGMRVAKAMGISMAHVYTIRYRVTKEFKRITRQISASQE